MTYTPLTIWLENDTFGAALAYVKEYGLQWDDAVNEIMRAGVNECRCRRSMEKEVCNCRQ